jgi:DNA-binding NtrC family response regulator
MFPTAMEKINALILDDDRLCAERLVIMLNQYGVNATWTNEPKEAIQKMLHQSFDILICDIYLPEMNGLEMLQRVKKEHPKTDVILISGQSDMNIVIKALRLGAIDFIKKPVTPKLIKCAIERSDKFRNGSKAHYSRDISQSLISDNLKSRIKSNFIGISGAMKHVRNMAILAAREKDVNVLITGENGTGKEIVARIIHYASQSSDQPFFPINCAAIPDSLLESEFFGHIKGSFTGAADNKKGFFELANNGTLFLDEISEMPLQLQAKLLRALEENKIKPVGGNKEIEVDLRIISATNSDIEDIINKKKLRIDLYHRLNTMMIHIPPLRERIEDVEPLVKYFIHMLSEKRKIQKPEIDRTVFEHLKKYHFPGNVRELKNMVERALILSSGKEIEISHFQFKTEPKKNQPMESIGTLNINQNEIKLIIYALLQCNNNNTEASKVLGISRDTLIRKKKKYDIDFVDENYLKDSPLSRYLI